MESPENQAATPNMPSGLPRYTPQFSETEQTPEQRWESVSWAMRAGSADGGGGLSPALVRLYQFYLAGEIDMAMLGGELDRLYPQQPSGDPRYPDPPAPRPEWPPLVLTEEPGRVYPYAAELWALNAELAQLPPHVPYTRLDMEGDWLE